jgi:hypothetical protein
MRFRSRGTFIAAATTVAVVGLVTGGATALAGSGSGSSGSGSTAGHPDGALFVRAGAGTASTQDCGPIPVKPPFGSLGSAAAYLGLSEDELAQELDGGKSLAAIATAKGKSVEGLKQVLLDAAKADLDEAVAAGKLTAQDAQAILSKLQAGIDDFLNGEGFRVRVETKDAGPGIKGGPFKTAAAYLGLSTDQLMQELRAGKSLAEITAARGKSVSGLKRALFEAAKADVEKAIDELVNQKGLPEPECATMVGPAPVGPALAKLHFAGSR